MNYSERETVIIAKALADENRLRILELLQGGEKCACILLEDLNVTQPTLSHHMKILCDAGIVTGRKEGKWVYYSLDETYRKRAVFLMHEDTAKALALLKDDQGRFLCGDSLCNTVPEKLFGCPVYTSRFMPRLEAGAKAIAFGDLSAYWIADRGNRSLRRLTELFTRQSKIGYRMTERVDGRLMIPEAVKVLQVAE